jgi:hypothetical protein
VEPLSIGSSKHASTADCLRPAVNSSRVKNPQL